MFGCLFFVFRSVVSLIMGLAVFFGFVLVLSVDNLRGNFLDAEFYTAALADKDVYNRFYDEVLLDPEFDDTTSEVLGNIDVPREDVAGVAKRIIPPDYLKSQVEQAVHGTIDYLNKDSQDAIVFIDLGPPLRRTEEELFLYIDGRIDELEVVNVTTIEELEEELEVLFRTLEQGKLEDEEGNPVRVPEIDDPSALVKAYVDDALADLQEVPAATAEDLERELEEVFEDLAAGELPTSLPSLEAIPVDQRLAAYDDAIRSLQGTLPKETLDALDQREEAIKDQLEVGSVKGALQVASPELTAPAVDLFVDDAFDMAFEALQDSELPQEALDGLEADKIGVKEHLGAGRTKEALKLGARGLARPLINQAIDEIRKELDDQDRLDLVDIAAEQNDKTREDFLDDIDPLRDVIDQVSLGKWLGILMMAVGVLIMGFVQIPHVSSGLRWPGLTLLLTGLVFLVVGLVAKSQVLSSALDQADVSPIPPSLVGMINDVISSMASDAFGGFITVSIVVMVIGFVMLVGSFLLRLTRVPFLST